MLYFYPKDDTPGCTKEACAFRDGYNDLQRWGIVVLGCSIDSAEAIARSPRNTACLSRCCSIPTTKSRKAYGADNGIPILGLDRRITYVIGEDGHILKVYPNVDPAIHAKQIVGDSAPTSRRRRRPRPSFTRRGSDTHVPSREQRRGVDRIGQ